MQLIELVVLDEKNPEMGLELISLVDKPAIEEKMYHFGSVDTSGLQPYSEQNPKKKRGKTKLETARDKVPTSKRLEDWSEEAVKSLAYIAMVAEGEEAIDYEVKFTYQGPGPERTFCDTKWTREYSLSEISGMANDNPGFGLGGTDDYDKFLYKGGVNCYHYWEATSIEMYFSKGMKRVPFNRADSDHLQMLEDDLLLWGYTLADYETALTPLIDTDNGGRVTPYGMKKTKYGFVSEEKRTIVSPVMIPDMKIIRQREETGEYYQVYFTADTIKKLNEKYFRELKVNNSTEMHDMSKPADITMIESWIIEDQAHDKAGLYGFGHLPVGTWMVMYKVNDEENWQKVKDGTFGGISLEGNFNEIVVKER